MLISEEAVAVFPQRPRGRDPPPSISTKLAGFCCAKADMDIHKAVIKSAVFIIVH
jgi:hypothetical protein